MGDRAFAIGGRVFVHYDEITGVVAVVDNMSGKLLFEGLMEEFINVFGK